ncbi:energy transducer TonB [Novosphingobium pokkalii]|uniref:Energy transducer TonB n=1 Tax=Novosphingobium pokkalii TaxID=1770194 RepID=A0ABV7V314_9SPHN|nr:TonB family protein [Novosphingobium pokkalii]GHD04026.1 hypothetical protein GCM10019060_40580 [Novosphingobium pokkalii]
MSAFRVASDAAPGAACTGHGPGAGHWRARIGGAGASLAVHGVLLALVLAGRWLNNADHAPVPVTPAMELHSIMLPSPPPRDPVRNRPSASHAMPTLHRRQTAQASAHAVEQLPAPPVVMGQVTMVSTAANAAPSPPMPAAAPVAEPVRAVAPPRDKVAMPAEYAHRIWARIMACRPPGIVMTGTVGLHFRLDGDGRLVEAIVAQPSGLALLDRAALQALRRATPFPPPPPDMPADALRFDVAVHFGARQQNDW